MEPLEAVLALQHLFVPVPALAAVAVGLALISLVGGVPDQAVKGVGELSPGLGNVRGKFLGFCLYRLLEA